MTEAEYEIIEGKFPETYNEVALVLPTKIQFQIYYYII